MPKFAPEDSSYLFLELGLLNSVLTASLLDNLDASLFKLKSDPRAADKNLNDYSSLDVNPGSKFL